MVHAVVKPTCAKCLIGEDVDAYGHVDGDAKNASTIPEKEKAKLESKADQGVTTEIKLTNTVTGQDKNTSDNERHRTVKRYISAVSTPKCHLPIPNLKARSLVRQVALPKMKQTRNDQRKTHMFSFKSKNL